MLGENLIRKLKTLLLIWLSLSTSFMSIFNTTLVQSVIAESTDGTCQSVHEEEEKWPVVMYCSEPAIVGEDKQFYVYVAKDDENRDLRTIELLPKGINIKQVEPLTPNSVSFVDGDIIAKKSGQFIVHGESASCTELNEERSCNNANCEWKDEYCGDVGCLYNNQNSCETKTGCSWDHYENQCYNIHSDCSEIDSSSLCSTDPDCTFQTGSCNYPKYEFKLESEEKKVRFLPVENCLDLVTLNVYSQESARQIYSDTKNSLGALGVFIGSGIGVLSSRVNSRPLDQEKAQLIKEEWRILTAAMDPLNAAGVLADQKTVGEVNFGNDLRAREAFLKVLNEKFPDVFVETLEVRFPNAQPNYEVLLSYDEVALQSVISIFNKPHKTRADHLKLGLLFGYAYEDVENFAETVGTPGFKTPADVTYEGYKSGKSFLPEAYFIESHIKSVDAPSSMEIGRSRLLLAYEILGTDWIMDKAEKERSRLIEKYPELDDYLPTKEDTLLRLDFLTGKNTELERYAKANDITNRVMELYERVRMANNRGDAAELNTILYDELAPLRDEVRFDIPEKYKEPLEGVVSSLSILTDDYYMSIEGYADSDIHREAEFKSLIRSGVFETHAAISEDISIIKSTLPESYIPSSEVVEEVTSIFTETGLSEKTILSEQFPILEKQQILDDAGIHYIGISETAGSTLEDVGFLRALDTIDKAVDSEMRGMVPDEALKPITTAQNKYGNLIYGAGLTAMFVLSPRLRELGERTDNALLLTAAGVVQTSGFAAMAVTFLGTVAESGMTTAIVNTLALLIDPINILGLQSGALAIDLPAFVIYITAYIIVNSLYCTFLNPYSSVCGCAPSEAYEKSQLRLEKDVVAPGDSIHFVIYGMQRCGPIGSDDNKQYRTSYLKNIESKDEPYEFLDICLFEDEYGNSCCEGEYKVDLPAGEYEIYGEVQTASFGHWKPYTDPQILTVKAGIEISSLSLEAGWNMISAPYTSVEFYINNCDLASEALHYTGTDYQKVSVDAMQGGVGYLVYSYNECQISLDNPSGAIQNPDDYHRGWNHIAVPLKGLSKLNVKCDIIEDPKILDPQTGSWTYVDQMVAGKSYFVDCYEER